MGEEVGYFGGAFKVIATVCSPVSWREAHPRHSYLELTIVGAGVGAAMGGLRPVVELMTINFGLLAMDQ